MKIKIDIPENLHSAIMKYCELNGIDINTELFQLIQLGFNIQRFGTSPFHPKPQIIEEEPIVQIEEKNENILQNKEIIQTTLQEEKQEKPKKTKQVRIIKN